VNIRDMTSEKMTTGKSLVLVYLSAALAVAITFPLAIELNLGVVTSTLIAFAAASLFSMPFGFYRRHLLIRKRSSSDELSQ
jgi:hypothetical protein